MNLDMARRLIRKHKISRRDFIQIAIAAGLSTATADRLFITAALAEPKRGGLFKAGIAHGSTTDSLDPALWTNNFQRVWRWVCSGPVSPRLTRETTSYRI
jgi:peptide/nickel transport system substrate-binding protein